MASARRLKEIAEANNAAFSETGTEWWLAEAPCVHDAPAAPETSSKKPSDRKQDACVKAAAEQTKAVADVEEPAAQRTYSFNWLQTERKPEKSFEKSLVWDTQNSCFVPTA